jgi:hypothetical protein
MNEYLQLLIILVMFSLYANYKYPKFAMIQALMLLGVIWLGIACIQNSESFIFPLILLLFHSIINIVFLSANYENRSE